MPVSTIINTSEQVPTLMATKDDSCLGFASCNLTMEILGSELIVFPINETSSFPKKLCTIQV